MYLTWKLDMGIYVRRKLWNFWTELLILVKLMNKVYDQINAAKEYSSYCNFIGVIDKKIGLAVDLFNKDGEKDVNGK